MIRFKFTYKADRRLKNAITESIDKTLSQDCKAVVYRYNCQVWNAFYIGQTDQPLHKRAAQHAYPLPTYIIIVKLTSNRLRFLMLLIIHV